MRTVADLDRQVRRNCSISDARFAGAYSVCGLAMRLRDLYKWEHALPPYEEHDAPRVLEWIGRKETTWETLQEDDFNDLIIDDQRFDPFDTLTINQILAPQNLFYGAGYAQGLKPSFLLAEIDAVRRVDGHRVVYLAAERARDLLTLPALAQDGVIVVRQSAAALYVWDQMLYLNRSGQTFFQFALAASGLSETDAADLRRCLPVVVAAQQDTFVYHEIGELTDTGFDGDIWRPIVGAFPHAATEFLVRAVKDILADTCPRGTLPQIVLSRNAPALGFYAAFFDGLAKALFPEIRTAIARFINDGRWTPVEAALLDVHGRAREMALTIGALYDEALQRNNLEWMGAELERRYIHPLTT